jgi:neutral ceramidase
MLESISRAAGIPASHIIIAASHDHNSPMIALSNMGGMFNAGPGSGAWIARAGKDIVNAVLQAQAALQPARIGIGSGKSYINANSNQLYPQGWRLGTNPDGPVDRTVWVLRFENLSGEPIAFLMNYAVHAIVMGPENRQLTADLPGAVSHFVESRYQDKAVALWTMGPAGDQNPVYMTWEPSDYATMEDIKSVHKTFEPGFSLVDTLGQMVGEEVVRVAANIKPLSTTARIYGAEKSVSCPGRKSVSGQLGERAYQDAGPVNFRLGLLMINDIALATVSGEVFVGIYRHLKNESPYSNTLMITMGNGRVGYFVDDVSYTTPYWQSMNTGVKPGCAENTIVNGILEMMGKR